MFRVLEISNVHLRFSHLCSQKPPRSKMMCYLRHRRTKARCKMAVKSRQACQPLCSGFQRPQRIDQGRAWSLREN